MQTQEIEIILQKYPYVSKYYERYVTSFINNEHPLINLILNNNEDLDSLNGLLEKLDSLPDIANLVKKSRSPQDFFNIMSEFKVASFLIDKLDKDNLMIISSKKTSPDFKIEISGEAITIEVKRIEDKRETRKGNVKYNPDPALFSFEWTDEQTIYNHIKKSIIEKKQYYPTIPHIIIFDCESRGSATSIKESDFENVLYAKKDKAVFKPTYSITEKYIGRGSSESAYEGVSFKNDRKEIYSCLSGVAAIFADYITRYIKTNSLINKESRTVFFRNPNADLNIEDDILSSLGMKIHEINFTT